MEIAGVVIATYTYAHTILHVVAPMQLQNKLSFRLEIIQQMNMSELVQHSMTLGHPHIWLNRAHNLTVRLHQLSVRKVSALSQQSLAAVTSRINP